MENFPINLNILKSYYILIILHTYDQSKEKKKKIVNKSRTDFYPLNFLPFPFRNYFDEEAAGNQTPEYTVSFLRIIIAPPVRLD